MSANPPPPRSTSVKAELEKFIRWYGGMIVKRVAKSSAQSVAFLILMNAGGVVVTLGLVVADPRLQADADLGTAVSLFLVGLVLIGAQFLAQLVNALDVVRRFGANVKKATSGAPLAEAFKPPRWYLWLSAIPISLGVAAFGCFIAGAWTTVDSVRATLSAQPQAHLLASGGPQAIAPATRVDDVARDQREKQELERRLVDYNGRLASYTKVLVIVGALQLGALLLQAFFLRLSFKEARRGGDIARTAMIASQRAFIFASGIMGYYEPNATTQQFDWRLRPTWVNSGDTPSRSLKIHSRLMILDDVLQPGFDFDYETTDTGSGLIGPKATKFGGVVPATPDPALTPQDVADMQASRKWVYLLGWARYRDVFEETPEHITRFCWLVTPVGSPLTPTPATPPTIRWDSVHHNEGNCADAECTA
jgi:hypothetical protein